MDTNFVFDEVVSVEDIKCSSLRYDITVTDNHNFFAGNILVHNCQNLQSEIEASIDAGDTYEVTVKLDGSSCTVYIKDGEVGICSRNLELKINDENAGNTFVKAATDSGLFQALLTYRSETGHNIAVQAELMGPGVQDNLERLTKHELYMFDIFDIDNFRYVTPDEREDIYCYLQESGSTIKHVPIYAAVFTLHPLHTPAGLLELADGPSMVNDLREGLVWKRADGKFSFKTISDAWLLRYGK